MSPYVHVHQSPMGWVMEVVDPSKPYGRQVVKRYRPLNKPTHDEKRRALNDYTRKDDDQ